MEKLTGNFRKNRWKAFCVFLLVACTNTAMAVQQPTIIQRLYTDYVTPVPVTVGNSKIVGITPYSGSNFTDITVENIIEFGYDVNYPKYVNATGNFPIKVRIQELNASNSPIGAPVDINMNIFYDPNASGAVKDKDIYRVTGMRNFSFRIIEINGSTATTGNDLPVNMYVEGRLNIDRIYDVISNLGSPPSASGMSITGLNIDSDPNGIIDEIEVTWPTFVGADEYQLEWTFINDYDVVLSGTIPANLIEYDFKHNATRISTYATAYRIPMLFDRGYVVFRVRAIGRDMTNPTHYYTSDWNVLPDAATDVSGLPYYYVNDAHEYNKNWQVTTTFAEEGKKKEVISYFDGSLRNRQTVTRVNSDNNVIVGETIYDHQGRGAVTVLPTPVEKPSTGDPALHYYEKFNQNASGDPYSRNDFDLDISACMAAAAGMNTVSGASNYYSPQNPDKNFQQAFVPDAHEYPFSQVEYTPDNTGRIRRQGGVGPEFQLDQNHETKYFYAQPNQIQLDRLFGSEVGDATHYKKNMVIDANGQVSVSYLDLAGKVIATSLAGDAPPGLEALESASTAATVLTVDLFRKNPSPNGPSTANTLNVQQDAIEYSTQLTVPYAGNHTFTYDFTVGTFTQTCLNEICFNCVYDLTLKITDECGNVMAEFSNPPTGNTVGQFTLDPEDNIVFSFACDEYTMPAFNPTVYLGVGVYTITKVLKVNQAALDYYLGIYLDPEYNNCLMTLEDFELDFLSRVDTTRCFIDCEDCIESLGDRDEFVALGLGTAAEWDYLYEQCLEECETMPSWCDATYQQLLGDVSPGGQYAEYLNDGEVDVAAFPVSLFNPSSMLPERLLNTNTWHNPKTEMNGTIYNYFINNDGQRAKTQVLYDGVTATPAVLLTAQIFPDGIGGHYTWPENLANVEDFVAVFKPEWAKGLVYLHPEYCYYKECREYGKKQGSDVLTSDDYDKYMKTLLTFSDAQTGNPAWPNNGTLIDGSGVPFDPDVVSSTNLYDPFLLTSNAGVFGSNAASTFMNRWNNYMTSPSPMSMMQAAAYAVRSTSGVPIGEILDFGQPVTGFNPAQNTAIFDDEWATYRGFYMALKAEVQQIMGDENGLTCAGVNDCIGNSENYNPAEAGLFDYMVFTGSPYFDQEQPCGAVSHSFYANKTCRFPEQSQIESLNMSAQEAGYQVYLQTGQCPKASALQGIMNEIAETNNIEAAAEPLLSYGSYNVFFLADNNYAPAVPIATNPLTWKKISAVGNNLIVHLVDSYNTPYVKLELDKTGTGITNWSDIEAFVGLQTGTSTVNAFAHEFTIQAQITVGSTITYEVINASTDYNISTCVFPDECDASPFALDLQDLMTGLAAAGTGDLTGSTVALNTSTYDDFVTPIIRAQLGVTPTDNLEWKYNSGTQTWTLKKQGSTNPHIDFEIVETDPTTYNLANLNNIRSFVDIISDYQNFFWIEGRNVSNNFEVKLKCAVNYTNASAVTTPLEMGECEEPTPLPCMEDPYVLLEDLNNVLEDLLLQTPFSGSTVDLYSSPNFTTLMQSYLVPVGSPTTSIYLKDITGPDYKDTLDIDSLSCHLTLTTNSTNTNVHIDNVASVGNMFAYGPIGLDNGMHLFKIPCEFTVGASTVTDTIFGSTCMPLLNCEPCPDAPWDDDEYDFSDDSTDVANDDSALVTQGLAFNNTSINGYPEYTTKINNLNTAMGWIPSNPLYVNTISYQDYFLNGIDYFQPRYSIFIQYFDITFDDHDWLTDPLKYAAEYGFGVNVQLEYDRYVDAINAYNVRAIALSAPTLTALAQNLFEDYRYADNNYQYIEYIRDKPAAGNAQTITTYFGIPGSPSGTCQVNYQDYINAWNGFQLYQSTNQSCARYDILPLYSYQTIIDNGLCCGTFGHDVFERYADTLQDTTACPLALPLITNCASNTTAHDIKDCAKNYALYVQLINEYNNSYYAINKPYPLPLDYNDFFSFYNAGKCECFVEFRAYLKPYLTTTNLQLDLPYSLNMSEPCRSGIQAPLDDCKQAYNDYIIGIMSYNTFAMANSFPTINIILNQEQLTADELCYCVDGYTSFLESIINGDYDLAYVEDNLAILNLDRYCAGRLTAPCTPNINLFGPIQLLPEIPYENPCVDQLLENAYENAEEAYNDYLATITTEFVAAYMNHCLGNVTENFTQQYTDKEYHFTLYYYDQAGNLIKTIPPAGVNMLPITSYTSPTELQVQADRLNNTQNVFTYHTLATTYEYNSLNQLVKQNMPDHDQMDIWETTLPNGLDPAMTITEVQYIDGSKGFLSGHVTGPYGQRGLLYSTNDAGATWQRVNDVVAANIRNVYFASATHGWAVGDNGVILRTQNAGSSWDMIETYGANINWQLNDSYFTTATDGVVVGNKNISFTITGGTTIALGTAMPNSTFTTGGYFEVTSITKNGTVWYAVAKHKASSTAAERGRVYISPNGLGWIELSGFNSPRLDAVAFAAGTTWKLAGRGGNVQSLNTAVAAHSDQATNVTGNIIDIYMLNANEGVAIIETAAGEGQIHKTINGGNTWTLFSEVGEDFNRFEVYEKPSATFHKLIAVGENGLAKRILLQNNAPFGQILLTDAATTASFKASWGFKMSNNSNFLMAGGNNGANGAMYYAYDSGLPIVYWTPITVWPTGEQVKKISVKNYGTDPGTFTVSAVVVSSTGTVRGLYRSSTGVYSVTSPITDGVNPINAVDLALDPTGDYVLAVTATGVIYRITISSGGITVASTALTPSGPVLTGTVTRISQQGTQVVITGVNGMLYTGVLTGGAIPTGVTWTLVSNKQIPLPFTGIENTASGIYISGMNGNVYKQNGGMWKQMEVATTQNLNAIALDNTAAKGVLAGDAGALYTFTPSTDALALTPVTGYTADLNDVKIFFDQVLVAGDGGTMVTGNLTSGIFTPVTNTDIKDLYGIAFRTGLNEAIAVGQNSHFRKVNTSAVTAKINQVFTPQLNAVHFSDALQGYAVGEDLTVRHTSNGGATWNVVVPGTTPAWAFTASTLPDIKGVFTVATNQATVTGTQGKIYITSNNTLNTAFTGATNETYYAASFANGHGYAVGGTTSLTRAYYSNNGGASWTVVPTLTGLGGIYKDVHTFSRKNAFMAVGTNGLIRYGDNAGPLSAPLGIVSSGTNNYNDIFFYDDVNAWLVGDNNVVKKSTSFTLNGSLDYLTGSWANKTVSDELLNQNTTNGTFNINAISMSSRTKGTLGGWFSDLAAAPVVQKCYARCLKDESGLYSTKFWYDRLGRIAVSQNTRQFNETTKKYSYTLYDDLDRIIEVGEKSENTSSVKFNTIFGTNVSGLFNPNTIDDNYLILWITDNTGLRREVVRTFYDEPDNLIAAGLPGTFIQENLRDRIACTAYYESLNSITPTNTYANAVHYCYDVHGGLKTLLQDNPGTGIAGQQFKRIDYSFDLITGSINLITYQNNQPDAWHHKYEYDLDGRSAEVFTSDRPFVNPATNEGFDQDVKRYYYAHGQNSRSEIGRDKVVGNDNSYTLQGWIKGTNSNILNEHNDIGQDGFIASANPNQVFARDVYGYSLTYFENDYNPIDFTNKWSNSSDRFEADQSSSDLIAARTDLYNGNITAMVTSITKPDNTDKLPQGMAYNYDQLNRLRTAQAYDNLDAPSNTWLSGSGYANRYYNEFTYDANGNITSQQRYNEGGTTIDDLRYKYNIQSGQLVQNRLYHLDDAVADLAFTDDIDDMGTFNSVPATINSTNNYRFDEEGRLIHDTQEEIDKIIWKSDGKIKEIIRTSGSSKKNLKFEYNIAGQRIAKHVYSSSNVWEKSTFYVLDARGDILAVYDKSLDNCTSTMSYKLIERNIYGGGRIGVFTKQVQLISSPPISTNTFSHELGRKVFEFHNHLSNILTIISDKKKPVDDGTYDSDSDGFNDQNTPVNGTPDLIVDYYLAEINNTFDYYPYGAPMREREFTRQVCETTTALNNQFSAPPSIEGYVAATGTVLSNSSGNLRVNKPAATGVLQTHKDFAAICNNTYTASFYIDVSGLLAGGYVQFRVRDLTTNTVIFTSPNITTTGNYGYNFNTVNTGNHRIEFQQLGASGIMSFILDNIVVNTTGCNGADYRLGFNGQEKDNEIYGKGNTYSAQYWEYDARTGRRWNLDPLTPVQTPGWSPYRSYFCNPVYWQDPLGLFETREQAKAYRKQYQTGGRIRKNDDGTYSINNKKTLSSYSYDKQEGKVVKSFLFERSRGTGKIKLQSEINVVYNPLPQVHRGSKLQTPLAGIILHRTVSPKGEDQYKSWQNASSPAATHFLVGEDGTVYQTGDLNRYTIHLREDAHNMYPQYYGVVKNSNTIGIEVIGMYDKANKKWDELTEDQIVVVAELVLELTYMYDLSITDLLPHEKVQHKTPGEGQVVLDAISNIVIKNW